jgi:ketosteroid isomerase-like protein
MSRENVEVAQRAFYLFNARDLAAFFELFDPDLTYHDREDEPDARLYRGREEYKGYVGTWLETFDDLRFEAQNFADRGDHVIVAAELHGRGRETGADVRGYYVFLLRVRDGRIVHGHEYPTTADALKAAGLSE